MNNFIHNHAIFCLVITIISLLRHDTFPKEEEIALVEGSGLDSPLKASTGYSKHLPGVNPDASDKAQRRNQTDQSGTIGSPQPKGSDRKKPLDLNLKPDPYQDIVSIGESSATDKKPPLSLPPTAEKFAKPIFGLARVKAFGAGYRGTF